MNQRIKYCVICGAPFSSSRRNKMTCSPKCSEAHRKTLDNMNREARKSKRKSGSRTTIAEINEIARNNHMTYGQYVGWLYSKRFARMKGASNE